MTRQSSAASVWSGGNSSCYLSNPCNWGYGLFCAINDFFINEHH